MRRIKYTVELTVREIYIYKLKIPADSVILRYENGVIVVCRHVPKRYGNMTLECYDPNRKGKSWIKFAESQNEFTSLIWKYHKHERKMHGYYQCNYKSMMKHDTVHKKGSGSRICDNQINGPLKYKQVTELAYWENLDNFHSGNASVVAAGIR